MLSSVFDDDQVTLDTIIGTVFLYLLTGLLWAYLYSTSLLIDSTAFRYELVNSTSESITSRNSDSDLQWGRFFQAALGKMSRPVGEQDLEDQWVAELLPRAMQQIRPTLPKSIIQEMTKSLVAIVESQGGLSADQHDAAVSHLREKWTGRISEEDIPLVRTTFVELTKGEMQKEISIPGMPNWWLMPIETHLGILTTGMRGLLGLKLYGTDLDDLAKSAEQIENVLRDVPGTLSVVAERAMGGHYLDIQVDRNECARYGLEVGDVQRMIETAIGGMNIATTVEGRYRFPINVRYPRELRDNPEKLKRVLIATPKGTQIPLGQVASLEFVDGPPVIKSESGMLLVNIPVDIEAELDIGTYVGRTRGPGQGYCRGPD